MDVSLPVIVALAIVVIGTVVALWLHRRARATQTARIRRDEQIHALVSNINEAKSGNPAAKGSLIEYEPSTAEGLLGPSVELNEFKTLRDAAIVEQAAQRIRPLIRPGTHDRELALENAIAAWEILRDLPNDLQARVNASLGTSSVASYLQAAYNARIASLLSRARGGDFSVVPALRDLLIKDRSPMRFRGVKLSPLPEDWEQLVADAIEHPVPDDYGDERSFSSRTLDEMSELALDAAVTGNAARAKRVLAKVRYMRDNGYTESLNQFGRSWELMLGLVVRTRRPVISLGSDLLQ
jgi:hypothetical protein